MNNTNTRFLTRTAILLALTVVFQMVGRLLPPSSNIFIVGPLVNACLLIATAFTGLWGGIIIAVLSPFTSLINNHAAIAPLLILFTPFVAIGNSILVAAYHFMKNKNQIAAFVLAAVLKFAFLYAAIEVFVRFKKNAVPLVALFTLPQLITALVGCVVAFIVIKSLGKVIED